MTNAPLTETKAIQKGENYEQLKKELDWYRNLEFDKWVRFLNTHPDRGFKRRMITMSLTDYSSLEQEIKDAPEPKTLARGAEVRARIVGVRDGISDKNNAQWYMPTFDVPDDPMVIEFNDFFWDLADRDKLDPKQGQRALYKFQKFAEAFGLDYSRPFSWTDDLVGLEGWVILGVRKSDEFGEQNTVSKYVAGR